MLIHFLNNEVVRLRDKYERTNVPCRFQGDDWERFKRASACEMCHRPFWQYPQLVKVRDHCHISGRFRYVLCSQCNLTQAKRPFHVYVFLHGLSNYDSHFLIQKLGMYRDQNISVIPHNSEKYLSFSLGCLKFKDSYQFLQCSLSTLVENLSKKGDVHFKNLRRFVPNKTLCSLLMRKGVFPYSFFSELSILNYDSLPDQHFFRNDLDDKEI